MSYIYEPEVEEQDDGYSIPKILVAVLILILLGTGIYIHKQGKKLTDSVSYLKDEKRKVRQELDEMIEKYNLAIENKEYLSDELRAERENIIKMRNAVENMTEDDFKSVSSVRKQIRDYKETADFVTNDEPIEVVNTSAVPSVPVEDPAVSTKTQPAVTKSEKAKESSKAPINKKTDKTVTSSQPALTETNVDSNPSTVTQVNDENKEVTTPKEEVKETVKNEEVTKPKVVLSSETISRVEVPPTFPGCAGNAEAKRKCFVSGVSKFVSSKFDSSLAENLGLTPGKRRLFASLGVDKQGRVVSVKAKGIDPILEKEAVRVINKLPKMSPARQDGSSIAIRNFTFPIWIDIKE